MIKQNIIPLVIVEFFVDYIAVDILLFCMQINGGGRIVHIVTVLQVCILHACMCMLHRVKTHIGWDIAVYKTLDWNH